MRFKLFTFIVLSMVLLSNKGGRNAPAAGAPSDGGTHCNQCHSGGDFTHDVAVTLKDQEGNVVTEYDPNTTYTLQIQGSATAADPKAYGFQLVMMDTLTNKQAGSFDMLGTNVRQAKFNTKDYLMQSAPREDGTFTAMWTSPDNNTGSVRAYVAILATNGNGNTSGDKSITKSFDFEEKITSSTKDINKLEINIYPNPAQDYITVQGPESITIIDQSGKVVLISSESNIDIQMLIPGVYFVSGEGFATRRFVKQ